METVGMRVVALGAMLVLVATAACDKKADVPAATTSVATTTETNSTPAAAAGAVVERSVQRGRAGDEPIEVFVKCLDVELDAVRQFALEADGVVDGAVAEQPGRAEHGVCLLR